MINCLFIFNSKGDVLMSKMFKDGVKQNVSDVFRIQVINSAARATSTSGPRDVRLPVLTLGSTSFLYIRCGLLWFVAVTRSNQDSLVILEFLFSLEDMLKDLFLRGSSGVLTEDDIIANFSTIYEMLDEMLDFGFPTNMELSYLASVVPGLSGFRNIEKKDGTNQKRKASASLLKPAAALEQAYDPHMVLWREPGIKYRRNEIFLNVEEKVHVLMNSRGESLRSYIDGAISMKTHLSGMPVCRFGFSDSNIGSDVLEAITLDDFKFHKCVDLAKYDTEQVIRFVPPDGTFELMTYHVASSLNLPFRVFPHIIEMDNKFTLKIRIRSTFSSKIAATGVVLHVPTPKGAIRNTISCSSGKAKFNAEDNAIAWKFNKFYGDQEQILTINWGLKSESSDFDDTELRVSPEGWSKLPMTLDFSMEMFSSSGLSVKFLKVVEKSNYRTIKWVKYTTVSGSYDFRL